MKKLMFLFFVGIVILASSCKFNEEETDDSGAMYEDYKIDENILKSANLPIVYV